MRMETVRKPDVTNVRPGTHPLLENGDALVLERLAELHDLGSLGVDGQRGHDQVGLLVHQLADETWKSISGLGTSYRVVSYSGALSELTTNHKNILAFAG